MHAGFDDYFCCTRGRFSVFISSVDDYEKACCISSGKHSRGLKPSPIIVKCLRKCHSWFQRYMRCMIRKRFVSDHAFYVTRFSSRRSRKSVLYLVIRASWRFETFTSHCQVSKGMASVISGLYDQVWPMKPRFWSIDQRASIFDSYRSNGWRKKKTYCQFWAWLFLIFLLQQRWRKMLEQDWQVLRFIYSVWLFNYKKQR